MSLLTAWQETYVISADADIWPVDERFFDLPPGKEILHGDLSGDPVPDVNKQTNAPLSFVGMRVRTWIEVNILQWTENGILQALLVCHVSHLFLIMHLRRCCPSSECMQCQPRQRLL